MEEAALRALRALELEEQAPIPEQPEVQTWDDVRFSRDARGVETPRRLLRSQSSSLARTAKLMQLEMAMVNTANQDALSKFHEHILPCWRQTRSFHRPPQASAPASVAGYEPTHVVTDGDDSDRLSFMTTGHFSSRSLHSDLLPFQRFNSLSSDGAHRPDPSIWRVGPPSLGRNSSGHTAPPSGPPSLIHSYYGPPSRSSMGPPSRSSGPPSRTNSGGGTAPSRSASGGSSRSKAVRNPSGGSRVRGPGSSMTGELVLEEVTESFEEGISPPNSTKSTTRTSRQSSTFVQALEDMASLEEPATVEFDPQESYYQPPELPGLLPNMPMHDVPEDDGEGIDQDHHDDTSGMEQQDGEGEQGGQEAGEEQMEVDEGADEQQGAEEMEVDAQDGEEQGVYGQPLPVYVPEPVRAEPMSRLSRLSRATTAESPLPGGHFPAQLTEQHVERPHSATSPISLVSSSDGQTNSDSHSPPTLDDPAHPTGPSSSQSSLTLQLPTTVEEPGTERGQAQLSGTLPTAVSFRVSRSNPWAPLPGPCLAAVNPIQAVVSKDMGPGTPYPRLASPQAPQQDAPPAPGFPPV